MAAVHSYRRIRSAKALHRAAAYAIFALLAAGCSSPTMSPRVNEFSKIERGASQNSSAHGTFKVIYTFNESDGYNPNGLIVDDLGDILGTTQGGGPDFAGVVFELRTRGGTYVERTLFSCNGQDCGYPYSTPYEDANGDLFITSWMSGRDRKGGRRQGSLIELSPEGRGHYRKSVVSRLSGHLGDGSVAAVLPQGSLLYAAAFVGGKYASGAIVAFTGPRLQESNVYSFRGNAKGDASNPNSNLVADASGALFGTTGYGGQGGSVFKVVPSPSGGSEQLIYNGGAVGYSPLGGVVLDASGNLYGVMSLGGPGGWGAVFKLTPTSGGYTASLLHAFTDQPDGAEPASGLVLVGDTLYGTTLYGGRSKSCGTEGPDVGCGTLFQVSTSGEHYAVLHSFDASDGAHPENEQLFYKGNVLYGSAPSASGGVVFTYSL
jgi:uncharacterized repeat protein (TIGR03803 family)